MSEAEPKPEVKVTMEVKKDIFRKASRVKPAHYMPGEGWNAAPQGKVKVKIIKTAKLN